MILKSIVYGKKYDDIEYVIDDMKNNFKAKGLEVSVLEKIEGKAHFIKIFCNDSYCDADILKNLDLYLSLGVYKILAKSFCNNIEKNMEEVYFFLKQGEMDKIKMTFTNALLLESKIKDDSEVYIENKKNKIVQKIKCCMEENNEVNLEGYITFREREMNEDFKSILDKVIENYMVEREYDEFIELLKYFVEIEECKIEEINIYADKNEDYKILDGKGKNLFKSLTKEVKECGYNDYINKSDLIISGLITLCPEKIILHCSKYFYNRELVDTIKKVFSSRVEFCNECSKCSKIKKTFFKS